MVHQKVETTGSSKVEMPHEAIENIIVRWTALFCEQEGETVLI